MKSLKMNFVIEKAYLKSNFQPAGSRDFILVEHNIVGPEIQGTNNSEERRIVRTENWRDDNIVGQQNGNED